MSIKRSLCQKSNATTLYNSQIGAVVFLCALSYKLSALPSIAGEYLSSSTFWFYLVLTIFDTIEFALLYFFFCDGSDERLKDKKENFHLINKVTCIDEGVYLVPHHSTKHSIPNGHWQPSSYQLLIL